MRGPNDLTTACDTSEGSHDSAPNEAREGLDCLVNTIPAMKAVNVMRNHDLLPMAETLAQIFPFPHRAEI